MKPGWSVQILFREASARAPAVCVLSSAAREGCACFSARIVVPQRVGLAPSRVRDLAPHPALRGGQAAVAYEASKDLAATAAAKATNTAAAAYETSKQYVSGAANVAADKSAQAAQQARTPPGRGAGRGSARRLEGVICLAVPAHRCVHACRLADCACGDRACAHHACARSMVCFSGMVQAAECGALPCRPRWRQRRPTTAPPRARSRPASTRRRAAQPCPTAARARMPRRLPALTGTGRAWRVSPDALRALQAKASQAYDSAAQGAQQAKDYTTVRSRQFTYLPPAGGWRRHTSPSHPLALQAKAGQAYDSAAQGAQQAGAYTQARSSRHARPAPLQPTCCAALEPAVARRPRRARHTTLLPRARSRPRTSRRCDAA